MKLTNIFLILFITGCSGLQSSIREAQSDPEVNIPNTTVNKVIHALNKEMTAQNYQVKKINPQQAVYVKPTGSVAYGLLYSSELNTESHQLVTYRFVVGTNSIKVLGTSEIVADPRNVIRQTSTQNQFEVKQLMKKILEKVKIELLKS